MKRFFVIACVLGHAIASAGETPASVPAPVPMPVPLQTAPHGWLGLEVSKPDEGITSHLPSLPPGIGFVVRSIEKDGPAAAAGLREYDIVWKLGDQMLVNESQLAALLRLSKPGDELTFSGFRGGKPMELTIKLGVAPAAKDRFPGDLVEASVLPGECGGPMRVVDVQDKTASYSTSDGRAEVRKEGTIYHVKIQGPKDESIYEGELPEGGSLEEIPQEWRRRVYALRRGLDHALANGVMTLRQPRPRVVAPPLQQP
jgi:hypothetical protein